MNNKSRRYALMSIIGLEKYATVVYNYIYYNLISSYRDSGKMKLAKIEGNGVIENQLMPDTMSAQTNYGYTATISNGIISITKTASGDWGNLIPLNYYMKVNHYYYFYTTAPSYTKLKLATRSTPNLISSNTITKITASGNSAYLRIDGNTDTDWAVGVTATFTAILIDLTLMFGTGNEPTTLTDNRIQNLLNRGYIAYNQGEYKGTNVGEIATEPYNLFDGELEGGGIDANGNQNNVNNFRTKNYTKVVPSLSYTFEFNSTDLGGYMYVYQYDQNKNYVADSYTSNGSYNLQLTANTHYVRVQWYKSGSGWRDNVPTNANVCIHRTGTRTGYAPHKPSASIPFIYQGNGALNAHDTFEITSSEYVFTRNVWKVDFGSLNWEYAGANIFYVGLTGVKSTSDYELANLICDKYATVERSDLADKTICVSSTDLITKDSSYTNANTYKSTMSGTYAYYELATPQVTRIPRKHLGIVDLGTITTGYVSNGVYYIGGNDQSFGIDVASSNANGYACYCSRFLRANGNEVYSKTNDNTICLTSPFIGNNLAIYSSSFVGKTADEIRALLSGVYLFYETENEVDDIATKIKYENGGTITTDSEVLPNVTMEVQV